MKRQRNGPAADAAEVAKAADAELWRRSGFVSGPEGITPVCPICGCPDSKGYGWTSARAAVDVVDVEGSCGHSYRLEMRHNGNRVKLSVARRRETVADMAVELTEALELARECTGRASAYADGLEGRRAIVAAFDPVLSQLSELAESARPRRRPATPEGGSK